MRLSAQGQAAQGLEQPAPVEGGWNWVIYKVPSNPNRPVIL